MHYNQFKQTKEETKNKLYILVYTLFTTAHIVEEMLLFLPHDKVLDKMVI